MATFTITTEKNVDELASKAGGDTYNVNGGTLVIDQDSRYGLNASTSASLGPVTISATLGGLVRIDGRSVRLVPFSGGSGNVPASNTVISQGGASGLLIGVWSAINAAPTAAGAAMPTSGFIKIKQWNSVEYDAGALSGITASATGPSTVGWIEVVGDDGVTMTIPRLGKLEMFGEWFEVGTTSGSNATTYQIPTSGSITYIPAVWLETAPGSGIYESIPCAGTRTALAASIATDAIRGKVCWVSTAGLLQFQHDGTNSTGGFLPEAGRKIRIPNIIAVNCITTARTANSIPHATLATRYDFTTTGGAVIEIDKALLNWYPSISQAFDVTMTDTGIATQLSLSEIASPMTLTRVCVGQEAANAQVAFNMTFCFAGGTITDCVWSVASLGASGRYGINIADISGFSFVRDKCLTLTFRAHAATGIATITRAVACTWTEPVIGGGRYLLTTCTQCSFLNIVYYDHPATGTNASYGHAAIDLASNCLDVAVDGVGFGGLANLSPYAAILNVGAAGCSRIKLRNLGTPSAPLELGAASVYGATWARSSTTATVTQTNHGLTVGQVIYITYSSSTAAVALAGKAVVAVTNENVFTFACTNGGATSGTISYDVQITGSVITFATGAAANDVKVQRCYCKNTRAAAYTSDNSSKNILLESCWGTKYMVPVSAHLNGITKGLGGMHNMTAQTAVYGTHWFDCYAYDCPPNTNAVAWTRSSTTATVTSANHGLITGAIVNVLVTSDAAAIILGQKSITILDANTFTFTCLNAGATSGTVTFEPLNSRIGILMNEATADTQNQYLIESGTPAFTSAGGLFMPVIGQQIVFTTPNYIIGHTGFAVAEAVMGGGTIANYDITYAIDQGADYGPFHNLYYARPGGAGTSGQYTFTVTNATGVEVGDYVWGTNIGYLAKVTQVNANTITVDKPNIGTVSGIIRFNHLPSEIIADAAVGFRMKIRIRTAITNTTAITGLYAWSKSTDVSRAYQYPLDTIAAKAALYGLIPGSEVRIFRTSDMAEVAGVESSDSSYSYNYTWAGDDVSVFIVVHSLGYVPIRFENMVLGQDGLSIPVQQQIDRVYSNP